MMETERKPGQTTNKKLDGHHQTTSKKRGSWEEAKELAADKAEWCQRVVQCIHHNVG